MLILAWLLSVGTAFPLLYFSIECLAGLMPATQPYSREQRPPPFAVLIPAHNEALGIADVIAAVRAQLRSCDRVVVVADNCGDETANIARAAGAELIERFDLGKRGKAYALARGRMLLRRRPPGVVIVLDADCTPEAGALELLAATASSQQAAVQGRYLLFATASTSPLVRISTFAFLIKNSVRQRGLQRLSGTALLQGTGMAFPWPMFDPAPLETASLVEDLKLGLDLVLAGRTVRFEDRAGFVSQASSQSATVGQRTRWEHGMLATAGHYAPRLLGSGLRGHGAHLCLAANLLVPPLLLLIVISAVVTLVLASLAVTKAIVAPLGLTMAAELMATLALFATWRRWGRELLPAPLLLRMPYYLAWKLPIYGRFITRRQRDWIRTGRTR